MVSVDIRYGKDVRRVQIPEGRDWVEIRKPAMLTVDNPNQAVEKALKSPVSSACLSDLAIDARNVCIAICDITRPVPNSLLLRPIINTLQRSGIDADRITIVVATGLHRPNVGKELEELIGDPWIIKNIQVVNHDAESDDDHVTLGQTPTRGMIVRINRRFVEADLRIATGLVEPHFMAGYSGGRKVVAPGLAHSETIRTFHSSRFMADPATTNCNFIDNPLHEEQLEIIKMLGDVYCVNTVIDEHRSLAQVNFGEIIASHGAMVDWVRDYCEVTVPQKYSTIITSAAGYPLDKTYYQTIKGMVGAMNILESGGDLIIASECSEGFGSEAFRHAQKKLISLGRDAFLRELLSKSHAETDEWQTQMQLAPMELGNVKLYTEGLTEDEKKITGVECVSDLQAAIDQSLARFRDPSLAIIPEGPYVIPFVQ